jgi:hypothetical protein
VWGYSNKEKYTIPKHILGIFKNFKGGDMGQIFCKEILEISSHHILMESIGREEYDEAWLLGMRKYFQLHDYPSNVEARIETYHLQGKTSMWWAQLKHVTHIDEKRISWRNL